MEHNMLASPRDAVSVVALQMQISEHEVFQHAHQCWYGKEAVCDIEYESGQFLLHAELPVWVRHFVRDNLVLPEHSTPRGLTVFLSGYMSSFGCRAFLRRTARGTKCEMLVAQSHSIKRGEYEFAAGSCSALFMAAARTLSVLTGPPNWHAAT